MRRVGVHCSVRNGFTAALQQAARLGCETVQIFTQSPSEWKTRVYTEEEFTGFRHAREELALSPIVVHSPYLPNLCTSNSSMYERSLSALISDLKRCEELGAEFLVIHPGAYSPAATYETGLKQFISALNKAFETVKGSCQVLIENMAGGGRRIGGGFKELADMLNGVKESAKMGICFDTCHATGMGYDISTESAVTSTLKEFDREVGLSAIKVFHVNDSEGALGSHRDLHEHLGKGFIGLDGFKSLFRHSAFKDCALILETPKDSPRADLDNLKVLRSCLN
jgi:deoxyribonuclease-4